MWDANVFTPAELPELVDVLHAHCDSVGRDPAEIRKSIQVRVTVGAAERVAGLLPRLRSIG